MTHKIIDVWAVHQDDDERDSGKPRWFFTEEDKAREVAEGRGWMGGKAPISNHKAVRVSESEAYLLASTSPVTIDFGPDEIKKMKEEALSKLTNFEKKVLGL